MFYAASEITFWILLSAIVGGGIGYGLSQARSVQLGKRLSESRADAPMERELAIAWDTIEDLNRRLQVAHETIRGGIGADDAALDIDPLPEPEPAVPPADDEAEVAETPTPAADDPEDTTEPDSDDPELAAPLVHTVEQVVAADELDAGDAATDGVVGTRLSDRVASASIGNQVEIVKNVDF